MNITSLVIMAAGLGSRYGGIKQLEPFGPDGEIIMDYSIFDAIKAGFDKIVIIIREDIYDDFMEVIGNRIMETANVPIHIAFQSLEDLPDGYNIPKGRTKPWGTGQAILSVKEYIDEPFLIINADDFYGREPYVKSQIFLSNTILNLEKPRFCLAGYTLSNTLSDNGKVTRGICKCDEGGRLISIEETYSIEREGDTVVGARVITDQDEVLIITEKGYGKRTVATEYPTKGRAGKGMKTANVTDKNGPLAGLLTVKGDEDLMIITDTGVMIRTNVANISQTGRSTMGVKVMRLDENAKIVTFTTVAAAEKEEVGAENETESEE
mgnify:CR=1 FL=1